MDDDGGGWDGGREASVLLACQFLPVSSSAPSLGLPLPATLILPSHSAAAQSLSFSLRLFSLLQSRRGDPRQKKGKARK